MAFTVSDIKPYVQANEKQLLGKVVVGAKTASMLNLQTGVKGTSNINLLAATTGLQDGSSCGWNASGGVTVSKRQIVSKVIKVNQEFCDKDLVGSSLQWGVKLAAGMESIPFEEKFIGEIEKNVQKEMETALWQGDTHGTSGTTNYLMDGFLAILSGETSVVDGNLSDTGKTLATDPYDTINNIVQVIPDAIIDRDDLVIFVGYDIYRKYIAALQAANLYHYTSDLNRKTMSTIIPGTNIRLEGVYGLNTTNKAVATYTANMYLGTDMENGQEVFKFWFDESNDIFKLKILFNAGVQVAFPDLVVIAS